MAKVVWLNDSKSSILITKENNETLEIHIGNFVSSSEYPNGIQIEAFIWNLDKDGPIGVRYIPWIPDEQRWDSVSWELTGGNKVDWSTVQLINNGVCPEINIRCGPPIDEPILVPEPSVLDTSVPDTSVPDTTVSFDTSAVETTVVPDDTVVPESNTVPDDTA